MDKGYWIMDKDIGDIGYRIREKGKGKGEKGKGKRKNGEQILDMEYDIIPDKRKEMWDKGPCWSHFILFSPI